MFSKTESLNPKHLIGMHSEMSFAQDRTRELWQRFIPRQKEVVDRVDTNYISMQVFGNSNGRAIDPGQPFTKWATVEVSEGADIPEDMEAYLLSGGLYAVFIHKGPAAAFRKTFGYIFGTWLPASEYERDNREQFEVLPEGYSPVDPEAEEEIWIPVKEKQPSI